MSSSDPKTPPSNEFQGMEARLRRALGVEQGSAPSAQQPQHRPDRPRERHRFVQDGEVPVTVVNPRRGSGAQGDDRAAALEAALAAERAARLSATRSLEEATSTIQSLRTKLAHEELAHREALGQERAAREQAEAASRQANAAAELAQAAQEDAEQQLRATTLAQAPEDAPKATGTPERSDAPDDLPRAARAPRRKNAEAPASQREPEPVKWWLPSYRSTKAGKRS